MARFKDIVKGLVAIGVEVDEIFTSPLVRAAQTADILAAGMPGKPPVKTLDALAPGHSPPTVMQHLSRAARRRRVALVGHEPGLGELAAHLIAAQRALVFKKGGVCLIDIASLTARRTGDLEWFLPPKVLRRLGG
jgi:phosphohistidine phosphatase